VITPTKPAVLDLRDSPHLGGVNTGLFAMAAQFASRDDIQVHNAVLSDRPEGWVFDRAREEGISLHWLRCNGPSDVRILRRLKAFILEKRIDLVVTNDYRANIYTRTLLDLGQIGVPTVAVKHGVAASDHWRLLLYHRLNRRPLRLATRVIAVDESTFKMLLSLGVSETRLRLIHNPAPPFQRPNDDEVEFLRARLKIDSDRPVIVYLGRIEREKGLSELLQVHYRLLQEGREICTIFVGEGSFRRELMEISSSLGGKHVIFAGPQVRVEPFLALSDIVTLPSYREGMPYALLEAMAAGKPVVATTVGGIPSLVKEGMNGLLVPPQDVQALFVAFAYLLDNIGRAREMGMNGYRRATQEFSPAKAVDSLIKTYHEALAEYEQEHG
jgi:glycosyltransferase involved in cell wall biosynthesis